MDEVLVTTKVLELGPHLGEERDPRKGKTMELHLETVWGGSSD
jgi:hypothetical protein